MNIFYILFIIVALQLKIINGYQYYDYYTNNLCFGSFPSNVGGMIIIYGENLKIVNNVTDSVIITVGGLNCTNINFENHGKLKCDISLDDKVKLRKGDQVNIIGLLNIDEIFVLFNFDEINACNYPLGDYLPFICRGDCFEYNSTKYLYLRPLPYNLQLDVDFKNNLLSAAKITITTTTTTTTSSKISFEISIDNNRISINGYHSKLRGYQHREYRPSINGDNVYIIISNSNSSDDTYLTLLPGDFKIKGESFVVYNSLTYFKFPVPKGIGRKDIKITQGEKSCYTEFEYDVPSIFYNAQLFDDHNIIGFQFESSSGIKEWLPDHIDQIKITFSNQSFYNDDIVIIQGKDGGFIIGIKYLEDYQLTNLVIQFGNVTVKETLNKVNYPKPCSLFTIDPILTQENDEYSLESYGGKISIVGKLFTPNIVNEGGDILKCVLYGSHTYSCSGLGTLENSLNIRPNCTYINQTLVTCETSEKRSLWCCFKVPQALTLILKEVIDPELSVIWSDYAYSMDSARLTINGNGFSNYIDSITVGDESCTTINLFNPQQIFCDLNNTQLKHLATSTKTINTGQVYVNVTMGSKSCGQFINFNQFEKYLNANPPNEEQSSSSLPNSKKSLPLDNSTQFNDQSSFKSNSKFWLISITISTLLLISFF